MPDLLPWERDQKLTDTAFLISKGLKPKSIEWEQTYDSRPDCSDVSYMNSEKDPNGISAGQPGAKLDAGKTPVFQGMLTYFPRALTMVAEVSKIGANKYSWKGWESVPDGINRYGDALVRHLIAEATEGNYDKDTGMLHAAQTAWNALARLELILREKNK